LIAGASYRFQIQALNAVGESAFSDEIAIYAATVPGNPSAPTMVSQSETQISIQWTALPSGSDGGSPVTDYKVYWDNGEGLGNFYLKQATTTPAMSFTATSLTAGTTYSFKIAAVNLVGEGPLSLAKFIMAARVPDPPTLLTKVSASGA
jgi:titin